MADIRFPQWRAEQESNNYPFTDAATLTNGSVRFDRGVFLDAAIYPVGGGIRMYISKLIVTNATVEVFIGDETTDELASGFINLVDPTGILQLTDANGRPAGLFVSEPIRLAALSTFGLGLHTFEPPQTELVTDVCFPTPEIGVRGILLDDGTLMTGDIWLVGGDGVTLQYGTVTRNSLLCNTADLDQEVITVNVVGDPLFRRRLCSDLDLFATPRFIRKITFEDNSQSFTCSPDEFGDIRITVHNGAAADTVLRVRTIPGGIIFESVGQELQGARNF